jgi:hypothetical protein
MRKVMVRYTVKPERAQENRELIEAVYAELARTQPAGLSYAAFVLEDGVTFVHVSSSDTSNGRSPLLDVPAFQEFQRDHSSRVAEGPVTTALEEVGSFRVWA